MPYILEVRNICKRFPGVLALNNVSLDVKRGEILGLVGENGAGKSTLIKILAGVYSKDTGEIMFDGQKVEILSPHHSHQLGISVIFQELNLFPNISVAENIFAGREKSRGGFMNYSQTNAEALALMKRVGLNCRPETLVCNLPVAQRQMVEVAKALSLKAKLIIMDEPTSSLTERETQLLFQIIRNLKAAGVSVIFISHRLNEIIEIVDRVHVLRDGENAGVIERPDLTEEKMIQLMVGRELKKIFPKAPAAIGEEILRVKNLTVPSVLKDISFELRSGEILGVAGLVGAGRTELMRVIFGLDPFSNGEIYINRRPVRINSPEDAIREGIAFVTEDRRLQGLILGMSIRENASLVALRALQRAGFIKFRAENSLVREYVQKLQIKTPSLERKVSTLSGGNQQKVVLAKWLAVKPQILILDEPTRGIDVGAKAEIHRIISDLAGQGVGIIMISSELPEVLGMSDRILVMHEGRITGVLEREEATQEKIMSLAVS
ncbi:MAG: sugar ABC transporter ATP-binding protein [Firmicutes bacterium]|nr:sugar ABC transporter ATP-binding protein [Bacillota bacterium]NLM37866.1 sugar ABC transporter ATP-binding protein [Bacillota bacterium]